MVIRMVIVDYDYDGGKDAVHMYPIWWMIVSLLWIFLGSIVVLNILIAVMSESYSDIMEKTGPLMARMERARAIARYERGMGADQLEEQYEVITTKCSPVIVKFDPVTDRETIDIVKEDVIQLRHKLNQMDEKIDQKFKEIETAIANLNETVNLYTSSSV